MSRIHIDSHYVALYADATGVVYKTVIYHGKTYPQETIVHAWGCKGDKGVTLLDDWGKSYHRVSEESLGQYSYQGSTCILHRGFPAMPLPKPADTARPRDKAFRAPTPTYGSPPRDMFAELGLGPPAMGSGPTHPRFPQVIPKPPFGGAAASHMDESGAYRGRCTSSSTRNERSI